jgi:pSer/pThr/pTyr-binding forkhead associated (FHA) protein
MDDRTASLAEAINTAIRRSLKRLPWRKFSVSEVVLHLAKEVVECSRWDKHGRAYAPDQYTLSIHPHQTGSLERSPPEVQRELGLALQKALEASDFLLVREPHITLATDPTLASGEIRVIAWHSSDPLEFTDEFKETPEVEAEQPSINAFLIVEGSRHFPLNQSVVTIGRLPSNDLVLSDSHISRVHAQLRFQDDCYELIDLQSTAGTIVNGRNIKKHTLSPGDVISIARTELIYGQDPSGPPIVTPPYTPPFKPVPERDEITPLGLKKKKEDASETISDKPVRDNNEVTPLDLKSLKEDDPETLNEDDAATN